MAVSGSHLHDGKLGDVDPRTHLRHGNSRATFFGQSSVPRRAVREAPLPVKDAVLKARRDALLDCFSEQGLVGGGFADVGRRWAA